ncbi:3'-5' exonuclease [Salininema proteolyticum]|uniref:Exonuclease domain-containing protein n=1 Tax=Salininema proteolyticum TaxID=1607685 RepID=A0ABV8U572_9ACTN
MSGEALFPLPGTSRRTPGPGSLARRDADAGVPYADWAVIDFETLNRHPASAWEATVVLPGTDPEVHHLYIRPDTPYLRRRDWGPDYPSPPAEWDREAVDFAEAFDRLHELLDGRLVLAHNARFEMGVFEQAAAARDMKPPALDFGCTVRMSRRVWPGLGRYGLGALCRTLCIANGDAHRSTGDTVATYELALRAAGSSACDVPELFDPWRLDPSPALQEPDAGWSGFGRSQAPTRGAPDWMDKVGGSGPLAGKRIFVSGNPGGIAKESWWEALGRAGATVASNPTQKDDYFCTDGVAPGRIKVFEENNAKRIARGRRPAERLQPEALLALLKEHAA